MEETSYGKKAIELANMDGWVPYIAKRIDNGVIVTGAVCLPITRGPHKGKPNYRKIISYTRRTYAIIY